MMLDTSRTSRLAANLARVRARMRAACEQAGRDPSAVRLVCVTKGVPREVVEALIALGERDFGENRLQVAAPKFEGADLEARGATLHFIGHLQRNKVRDVLGLCRVIHSVDSSELAREIDKRARAANLAPVACFLEVNVSGEASKQGCAPADLPALAALAFSLSGLRVSGLMTMAPAGLAQEQARTVFGELRRLRDGLALPGEAGLSMGMSGDFEAAILEGSTHVRVGSALFEGVV